MSEKKYSKDFVIISGLKNKMIERINEFECDGKKISKLLYGVDNCVMAGSFPLQVLLGEKYENSDIDIFISNSDNKYNFDFYYDKISSDLEMYCLLNSSKKTFMSSYTTCCRTNYGFTKNYTKIDPRISSVMTYSVKKIDIQFVRINFDGSEHVKNNMEVYINKSFDLSFCKVMFDGNDFIIHKDILVDVMNKRGKWAGIGKPSIENEAIRIEKYESRGFTITNKKDLTHKITKLLSIRKQYPKIIDKLISADYIVNDFVVLDSGTKKLVCHTRNDKKHIIDDFSSEDEYTILAIDEYCGLYPKKHVKMDSDNFLVYPKKIPSK
jgi:hypothetical protein